MCNKIMRILIICSVFFAFSCSITLNGDDPDYTLVQDKHEDENDDFYRTTNVIKFGKSNRQTHSIFDSEKTANDKDYIILNATAGKCYKIQTWAANNDSIDITLELQTETGTLKAYNDNNGVSTLSLIDWWECEATGLYYIIVSGRKIGWYGIDVEEFNGVKIVTFPYSENFELSLSAPWINWVKDSFIAYDNSGNSIKTIDITDGVSTSINLLATIPAPGKTLSFYWQVNSEKDMDYFSINLDGVTIEKISGNVKWEAVSIPLTSGTHLIEWKYAKNGSKTVGYDCAWLDNISIQ